MHAYLDIHLYNDNSDHSIQFAAVNYVILHMIFECEIASVAMDATGTTSFVRILYWERKETKSMPSLKSHGYLSLEIRICSRILNVHVGDEESLVKKETRFINCYFYPPPNIAISLFSPHHHPGTPS